MRAATISVNVVCVRCYKECLWPTTTNSRYGGRRGITLEKHQPDCLPKKPWHGEAVLTFVHLTLRYIRNHSANMASQPRTTESSFREQLIFARVFFFTGSVFYHIPEHNSHGSFITLRSNLSSVKSLEVLTSTHEAGLVVSRNIWHVTQFILNHWKYILEYSLKLHQRIWIVTYTIFPCTPQIMTPIKRWRQMPIICTVSMICLTSVVVQWLGNCKGISWTAFVCVVHCVVMPYFTFECLVTDGESVKCIYMHICMRSSKHQYLFLWLVTFLLYANYILVKHNFF